jgi:hypothetical protein
MNKTLWQKLIKKAPYAQKLISKNIKYPTKEKQLATVRQDDGNIQYIHNPDKEVQLVHYLIATCPELLRDPKYDLEKPNE